MELVAPQLFPRGRQRVVDLRGRSSVAEGQPLRHAGVGVDDPGQAVPVELVAQPQQPAALGPGDDVACAHVVEQGHVVGQGLGEHFGEAAADIQAVNARGQAFVVQGVEGDHLGPRPFERFHVVGIDEGERRPGGHGHDGVADATGGGQSAHVQPRCGGGDSHEGVEVTPVLDGGGETVERPLDLVALFHDRDEPQMPVSPCEMRISSQNPEHGNAGGDEGFLEHGGVAVAAHLVEDHARHAHRWVEGGEAVHEGGHRAAHGLGVDHEHDGGVEQGGHVRGAGGSAVVGGTVEEAHDALDHQHVGVRCGTGGERGDGVGAADPGIEVAARSAGGQAVVAGVDEVGADLGGRHPEPPSAQGGHEPGGDRRLAHSRRRARHHEPGDVERQNSIPFMPLIPWS
ncbi:MAG TPA: hypothetical protein VM938_02655 [Acidimicrobiales bacterium]|nr:hypothetical protein [Acidimicrobiales bacterium]